MRHITFCFSRLFCFCSLLFIQPVFAGSVALGTQFSAFDNFIIVGLGGTDAENCTNLQAAIAATSGTRTIKLPPATYDCGTSETLIPESVTLEGSGQGTTRIISAKSSAVVIISTDSGISNLTVENVGAGISSGSGSAAVDAFPGSRLTHVTLISEGANNGENTGLEIQSGVAREVIVSHVTIRVDNALNFNEGILTGSTHMIILNDVNILALDTPGGSTTSCGIFIQTGSSTTTIRNSVISGVDDAIAVLNSGTQIVNITHSELANGVTPGAGTFNCFGAYDESLGALSATCGPPPP
jgi:hypothetical protein